MTLKDRVRAGMSNTGVSLVERRVDWEHVHALDRRHHLPHRPVAKGEGSAKQPRVLAREAALLGVRRALHVELDELHQPLAGVNAANLGAQQPVEKERDRDGTGQNEDDKDVRQRQRSSANLEGVPRADRLRDDLAQEDDDCRRNHQGEHLPFDPVSKGVAPDGVRHNC